MSGGDVTARLASIRQRVRVGDCTGVVPAYFSDVPWLLAELEAAEARTARLRDELRDFAEHGLRCDLNPTIAPRTGQTMYAAMRDYLQDVDCMTRDRARAALSLSDGKGDA